MIYLVREDDRKGCTRLRHEIWMNRNGQGDILVVFPDLSRPRGFTIGERCEPGVWIYGGANDTLAEMVPVSHPFYSGAVEITDYVTKVLGVHPFEMVEGGREALERMARRLMERLDREMGCCA